MQPRLVLVVALALSLVTVALLTAACGGNPSTPSVANLGGTTTSQAQGRSAAPPAGSAQNGTGGGQVLSMKTKNGAKFAACMRAHGVPNFPDPSSNGTMTLGPNSGVNLDSPKFRAAQQTCRKLLPNGGQPSPQQVAKMQQQALAFSACMRSHGIHDFPDPNFSGGGIRITIHGGSGSDLNPNNPRFQAAQKACQGHMPGIPGPAGGK
jgi:hypothetical protein